ncbi:MAG: hypothetical protein IJ809_05005 [Clostridia bacterium]|nr:hypothetical protein [Clostridia bacterium]
MYSIEKILNEITLIFTLVTMLFVFLYKYNMVKLWTVIFMCILTILMYLSSRLVNNSNSKITEKDKEALSSISKSVKKERKKK